MGNSLPEIFLPAACDKISTYSLSLKDKHPQTKPQCINVIMFKMLYSQISLKHWEWKGI